MKNKLTPNIKFMFTDYDDVPEFTIKVNMKTKKKSPNIKIIAHKIKKNIILDSSTKLF
jgi:hypothetical protein